MGFLIKGVPLGMPATNDEYEECDIPVREGRVENYRIKDIEVDIDYYEQGLLRKMFVINLLGRENM